MVQSQCSFQKHIFLNSDCVKRIFKSSSVIATLYFPPVYLLTIVSLIIL